MTDLEFNFEEFMSNVSKPKGDDVMYTLTQAPGESYGYHAGPGGDKLTADEIEEINAARQNGELRVLRVTHNRARGLVTAFIGK